MKKATLIAVSIGCGVLVGALLLPVSAQAQVCPGFAQVLGNRAIVAGAGMTTLAFVSTGSNCTGMASGAATTCVQIYTTTSGVVVFSAWWPSVAALTGDTTGGCRFNCPGGTCRVGNNGLPVELMEFSIE